MANQEGGDLVTQLVDLVKEISGLPDCRNAVRKMYGNLMRRVKLLSPLFEELKDNEPQLDDGDRKGLQALRNALNLALELLKLVNDGSKIFQALQFDKTAGKFHVVTTQIEEALSQIHYDRFNLSEEVHEQIKLVHGQFRRAKGRMDSPDLQLQRDLAMVSKGNDPDPETVKRLSEKLYLTMVNDLKRESIAIHDMAILSGGDPEERFEMMSFLLKKIKDLVMLGNPEVDTSDGEKSMKHRSPVIPDDFRCPISLELMKDPVIVSTGQTYERSSIQKWLDAGHKMCPKTQQTLLHTALTPNYVLKSLIALWCDSNGVELPKSDNKPRRTGSECDRTVIGSLLQKLVIGDSDEQRSAAGELRLLAKRNADNRVCIAEAGAIPLLVELLSSHDGRTQEHAVTALLNLSINEANKGIIVSVGAIPDIVDVLKNGSTEARENAAATLFSLSVVDENKVAIGAAGAIQPLINLLQDGTPRGKKDAATAIFNLCIYQGNKVRAVRAGIVTPLMRLLEDASHGMMDEALAILAILASHHEGKMAIAEADPMPVLVEVIRTGSARNRENGSAVLWSLCAGDVRSLKMMKELGAEEVLKELSENGTDRAKRKAGSVLELLQRVESVETVIGS
ncbi:U-box domain-containing protein 14 [Cynara cardunculus var. scolymus]|uniref:RING-type E3 ubiquitin transferase n=1 Tax=Cynara cardunculus var. scolymus TaxID=59895 RepID=A0A103YIG9_CYNCS|nr:U-box domain-containing protein 14 [Cynara cardunculus var. scolymus]KVI09699.1 Armadillo [Cynara cardunculus var. scolymus]